MINLHGNIVLRSEVLAPTYEDGEIVGTEVQQMR